MTKNKICLILVLIFMLALVSCSSQSVIGGADEPTGIYITK